MILISRKTAMNISRKESVRESVSFLKTLFIYGSSTGVTSIAAIIPPINAALLNSSDINPRTAAVTANTSMNTRKKISIGAKIISCPLFQYTADRLFFQPDARRLQALRTPRKVFCAHRQMQDVPAIRTDRSEEHTSELQSPDHL